MSADPITFSAHAAPIACCSLCRRSAAAGVIGKGSGYPIEGDVLLCGRCAGGIIVAAGQLARDLAGGRHA